MLQYQSYSSIFIAEKNLLIVKLHLHRSYKIYYGANVLLVTLDNLRNENDILDLPVIRIYAFSRQGGTPSYLAKSEISKNLNVRKTIIKYY